MSTGSILLGFALFLGVAFVLAYPFLSPNVRRRSVGGDSARQELLAEKEMLLTRLRVLDFDHETGKIPDDIYEAQRLSLKTKTAAVLQALDQMPAEPRTIGVDNEIEAAISRRRQHTGKMPATTSAADEIEAAVARRRQQVSATVVQATVTHVTVTHGNGDGAPAARFCPQCGQATDAGDKFCARCGAALARPAQAV